MVSRAHGSQSIVDPSTDRDENGAVAQLGERNTGSVEVRGSSPLGSTKTKSPDAFASGLFFAGTRQGSGGGA